jgi:hypothetical protein
MSGITIICEFTFNSNRIFYVHFSQALLKFTCQELSLNKKKYMEILFACTISMFYEASRKFSIYSNLHEIECKIFSLPGIHENLEKKFFELASY